MAFTFIQLLIDVILVTGLLLVLLGRGWRRNSRGAGEPAESREFLLTLQALIKEMQETADRLERRLDAKRGEVERSIALADDRIEKLEAAGMRAGPAPAAATRSTTAVPAPRRAAVIVDQEPAVAPDQDDLDDDARADRYRQVVDFARKGWDAAEIAKHTRLPRGEVDLLLKTRGRER